MRIEQEAAALAALGNPTRLAVFRLLARRAPGGVPAAEIAQATGTVPSTLSGHLEQLVAAGLATRERRGRQLLYRVGAARVGALLDYLVGDCCRGRPELCAPGLRLAGPTRHFSEEIPMARPPFTVLFLCTGNSARSIMAEAILTRDGGERFRALSAGTRPKAEVHPLTLTTLADAGLPTKGYAPKSPDSLEAETAKGLDFVFTLCDAAANEECPIWPGQPLGAHWSLPDPAAATGTEAERGLAFRTAFRTLERRIASLVALPVESLDRASLQRAIDGLVGAPDAA